MVRYVHSGGAWAHGQPLPSVRIQRLMIHYCGVARRVGGITFAGSGLQTAAVENRDIPSAIANQLAILKRCGCLGNADPPNPKHEREEYVRYMKRA